MDFKIFKIIYTNPKKAGITYNQSDTNHNQYQTSPSYNKK